MSDIEKHEIADRVKAMDIDELKVVVRCIPDDLLEAEIDRREAIRIKELQRKAIKASKQRLGIRKALSV